MFDIITLGSNYRDIFVHTDKEKRLAENNSGKTENYLAYPIGGKILVTEMNHNFGGNGMNSAVCLSKLGFKTGYIGKTGQDEYGSLILSELKKNKIAFLGKKTGKTGTSIILDAVGEDRTILTFKGSNNQLKLNEVEIKKVKAKAYYFSSMLGESLNTMKKIFEIAKSQNALISLNPSQTIIEHEKATVEHMIISSNILVLNKEEAELLAGSNDIMKNLKRLSSMGPKTVVITDGKNGANAFYNEAYYSIKPKKDLKIVETTGAGDAFASTLLAGLIRKKPFEFCLKMAIINSESVISTHGAQNGLLPFKKLLALALKDKRKIDKIA